MGREERKEIEKEILNWSEGERFEERSENASRGVWQREEDNWQNENETRERRTRKKLRVERTRQG